MVQEYRVELNKPFKTQHARYPGLLGLTPLLRPDVSLRQGLHRLFRRINNFRHHFLMSLVASWSDRLSRYLPHLVMERMNRRCNAMILGHPERKEGCTLRSEKPS